jgi:hypothetical protein
MIRRKMYLYFFPAVAAGLVKFLYDSWWRATLAGGATLLMFVGMVELLQNV